MLRSSPYFPYTIEFNFCLKYLSLIAFHLASKFELESLNVKIKVYLRQKVSPGHGWADSNSNFQKLPY